MERKVTLTPGDRKFLFAELENLEKSGVLSAETQAAARELYVCREPRFSFRKTVVGTAVLLGLLAFVFCVYIAFGDVWETLSERWKTTLAVLPFSASYVCCAIAKWRKSEFWTTAFLFTAHAFFIFAAGYVVAAYGPEDFPFAGVFLAASATTAIAAFCSRSRALQVLALCLICATEVINFKSSQSLAFCGSGGSIPWDRVLFHDPCALSLLPLFALGLYWCYRRAESELAILYCLGLGYWCVMTIFAWDPDDRLVTMQFMFLGSATAILGRYCRVRGLYKFPLDLVPMCFLMAALLVGSDVSLYDYEWVDSNFSDARRLIGWKDHMPVWIFSCLAVVSAILLVRAKKATLNQIPEPELKSRTLRILSTLFSPGVAGFLVLPVYVMFGLMRLGTLPYRVGYAVWVGAVLSGLALRQILLGAKKRPFYFMSGAALFAFWLWARADDWMDTARTLNVWSAAIFFVGVALALFLLARFVNRRAGDAYEVPRELANEVVREPRSTMPDRYADYGVRIVAAIQVAIVFYDVIF